MPIGACAARTARATSCRSRPKKGTEIVADCKVLQGTGRECSKSSERRRRRPVHQRAAAGTPNTTGLNFVRANAGRRSFLNHRRQFGPSAGGGGDDPEHPARIAAVRIRIPNLTGAFPRIATRSRPEGRDPVARRPRPPVRLPSKLRRLKGEAAAGCGAGPAQAAAIAAEAGAPAPEPM